jgi:uncharacterized RDD family membrane protein YckC
VSGDEKNPLQRGPQGGRREPLITRREMAGWVDGPGGNIQSGRYPGERLGLPESGPASLARPMRRIAAVCIDWAIALLISTLAFDGDALATLVVFALMHVVGLTLLATTVGKALVRIQVVRLGGGSTAPIHRVLVRTVLLCLVIPLMVVDPDGRSLHDKAAGTVELVM